MRTIEVKHQLICLDGMVKTILHGLTTDGAHHKQFTLETLLLMMCEDSWVAEAKKELQWEDGIQS